MTRFLHHIQNHFIKVASMISTTME